MSSDKHSEELRRYLSGEMTHKEANAFERNSLEDPFLNDAVEGAEEIGERTFMKDVDALDKRIQRTNSQSNFTIWRVAATIALLIIGGFTTWYMLDDFKEPELAQDLKRADSDQDTIEINSKEEVLNQEGNRVEEDQSVPSDINENTSFDMEKHDKVSPQQVVQEKPKIDQRIEEAIMGQEEFEMADVLSEDDRFATVEDNQKDDLGGGVAASSVTVDKQAEESKKVRESANHNRSFFKTRSEDQVSQSAARSGASDVKGRVTDGSGDGLPGVNVVVKGTTNGVTTDLDGEYKIAVNEDDELVFSSIGMTSQEVIVGSREVVDVEMSPDVSELQEVVVTGYGAYDNEPEGFDAASPVSGWKNFDQYIDKNLTYPIEARAKEIEGRVVLQLSISRTGKINGIDIKRSLGYGCDEEAIRLINEGPTWRAASRDGKNVESRVRVRIRFELD